MRVAISAVVLALLWASSVGAQDLRVQEPAACPAPVNWRWVAQPDQLQASLIMGESSSSKAKAGAYAVALCEIGANLHPAKCTVLQETPSSNMGDVVIKLSKEYKAASKDNAGESTLGRKFCFSFGVAGNAAVP